MKTTPWLCLFVLVFVSCEKNIDLSVNQKDPTLVVDASIENNQPPLVVLSKSLSYFSSISKEELENSFVHDAVVTVNNGSSTMHLKEYSFSNDSGYSAWYYTIDPTDLGNFLGEYNTTYYLQITTADGKEYSSQTTIPPLAKKCDSLWWEEAPLADSSECILYGKFTDPPGLGNYVRYFTQRNSDPFLPGLNSVFDDQVIDGITYSVPIDLGWNKNSLDKPTSDNGYGYAYRGDTVTLKFCNIDKASYNFWNTWEFSWQSYGNPFSSPVKVLGNINNGALGVFCGYAAQYKTIIIPR